MTVGRFSGAKFSDAVRQLFWRATEMSPDSQTGPGDYPGLTGIMRDHAGETRLNTMA